MRLIVSNENARELDALMTSGSDGLTITLLEPEDGGRATITVSGTTFEARARATPSDPGTLVVEDFDGRIIVEGTR